MHRGEFRGSESFIWTPGSFWEDEPEAAKPGSREAGKLRLYLPEKYLPTGDAGGEDARGGCPRGAPAKKGVRRREGGDSTGGLTSFTARRR